jgi:hypothetical protein
MMVEESATHSGDRCLLIVEGTAMKRMSTVARPHRLMTEHEAGAFLNIDHHVLTAWRWTGGGPDFVMQGHKVRYRPYDLAHWLDKQARLSAKGAQLSH